MACFTKSIVPEVSADMTPASLSERFAPSLRLSFYVLLRELKREAYRSGRTDSRLQPLRTLAANSSPGCAALIFTKRRPDARHPAPPRITESRSWARSSHD